MDKIQIYFYLITIVTVFELIWVNGFLDIKIESSLIPTLVNGITSSLSVITGFMGAFVGIMFREIRKKDKKARNFYFWVMVLFAVPLNFLWTTYFFLTVGWSENAVKYALSGLILTLYMFFAVILRSVKILNVEPEKS